MFLNSVGLSLRPPLVALIISNQASAANQARRSSRALTSSCWVPLVCQNGLRRFFFVFLGSSCVRLRPPQLFRRALGAGQPLACASCLLPVRGCCGRTPSPVRTPSEVRQAMPRHASCIDKYMPQPPQPPWVSNELMPSRCSSACAVMWYSCMCHMLMRHMLRTHLR
jgi:hypothetical protein